MEKIKNTSELKRNLEVNREKLLELMKAYDLAVLGYQVHEQRCNDIYDKVLSEHEFYASIDCARAGINIGDRIAEEKFDFLLSDEDFEETSKEIYEEYKKEFSSWQCEDNLGLVVKFSGSEMKRLFVSFFFETD